MSVRVLLVDDHALLRAGLEAILGTDDSIEVVGQCADGPSAVRLAAERAPDLVLMDVQMPGGDGLTATAQILAANPAVRVVVLTMFDFDDYVLEALRAGASGYLLKTTPPTGLIAAVKDCVGGEMTLGPSVVSRLVASYVQQAPPTPPPAGLRDLTPREFDVLRVMARGLSNAEVGTELHLAETTVKTHVARILTKLGVRDRLQAVVIAHENGIVRTHG
jgi:DNA-binding NarL/FixJ family response regulator